MPVISPPPKPNMRLSLRHGVSATVLFFQIPFCKSSVKITKL